MHHTVVHTVIEGILIAAYSALLLVIITSKAKNLQSPFYVIFVATGIADILAIMVNCYNRLNRLVGFGPELRSIAPVAIVIGGTTFLTHMIGNMLLTINRYSALCLLKKYDKIWSRRNVWIMIILQYTVSLCAFTHLIPAKLTYKQDDNGTYTFSRLDPASSWRNRYFYCGPSLLCSVMSVCFNTKLFIEWRRLSKSGGSTKLSHHEKSLLLYTAFVFVATMMLCLQQLMKAVATLTANTDLDLWVTMQFYWVHDVMVCTPPFCLAMLSADLRKDIVNILRCRRHQKSNFVSNSVVNTRSTVRR